MRYGTGGTVNKRGQGSDHEREGTRHRKRLVRLGRGGDPTRISVGTRTTNQRPKWRERESIGHASSDELSERSLQNFGHNLLLAVLTLILVTRGQKRAKHIPSCKPRARRSRRCPLPFPNIFRPNGRPRPVRRTIRTQLELRSLHSRLSPRRRRRRRSERVRLDLDRRRT